MKNSVNNSEVSKYSLEYTTTSPVNNNKQKGGGLLSMLLPNYYEDSCDFNGLAMEAVMENEIGVLSYLIRKNKITDYTGQDANTGYTILHRVIESCNNVLNCEELVDIILKDSHIKDFINKQDLVNKNTPFHLAVMTGNHVIANKLEKAGADPKIQNADNFYVGTESEMLREVPVQQVQLPTIPLKREASVFIKKDSSIVSPSKGEIDNMVDRFLMSKKPVQPTSEASLRLTDIASAKKEQSGGDVLVDMDKINTDKFIQSILHEYTIKPLTGGNIIH